MSRQPGGRVYHPEYGEAIAADAVKRFELVRQLGRYADEANTRGDRLLLAGEYTESNRFWRYAARCVRSSRSIAAGYRVESEDWPIVGRAWLAVQHGSKEVHDWVDQLLKELT